MMQSGRAAFASSGRISGSGLASARMIGRWRHRRHHLRASARPAAEQPRNTSAPFTTSASVRASVCLRVALLRLVEARRGPRARRPCESTTKMFSGSTPSATIRSRHAIAAAPAPDTAIFTSPIVRPVSSRPLSSAAREMIAVPCWSSWKTGIFSRSRSLLLDVEALGRLDVLEVDAAQRRLERGDDLDQLVGVLLGELDVEHVDAGELLEQAGLALHHRLAGERADVAQPQHRGAVGDDADEVRARGVARPRATDPSRSRGTRTRRPANRRATGRAGSRAAWSARSRSCRGRGCGGTRARRRAALPRPA